MKTRHVLSQYLKRMINQQMEDLGYRCCDVTAGHLCYGEGVGPIEER